MNAIGQISILCVRRLCIYEYKSTAALELALELILIFIFINLCVYSSKAVGACRHSLGNDPPPSPPISRSALLHVNLNPGLQPTTSFNDLPMSKQPNGSAPPPPQLQQPQSQLPAGSEEWSDEKLVDALKRLDDLHNKVCVLLY